MPKLLATSIIIYIGLLAFFVLKSSVYIYLQKGKYSSHCSLQPLVLHYRNQAREEIYSLNQVAPSMRTQYSFLRSTLHGIENKRKRNINEWSELFDDKNVKITRKEL